MANIFTELRKVELTLQRLTIIAEQVNEGVMVADLDGTARFVNTAMAKMHGHPSGNELIGKNISVFHSEDQMKTDVFPMIEEVKRRGRFLGPIEHLRNDGTVFPTQTKMTLLKDGKDKAVGLVVFVTDITERMQVEKSFTKQILELATANEQLQREISNQRQTIEQLTQFRDELKQQFEQQQAQLTTTEEQLQRQLVQSNQAQEKLQEYHTRLEQRNIELAAAQKRLYQQIAERQQLEQNLEQRSNKIKAAEEQLQAQSTKLQLAQQQINEQAAESTTLKQWLQKQADKHKNVEQQLRQHSELSEQHAAELTSANQQLEQQQAQLIKANEQLKRQVENLTAEHRQLEETMSENTEGSYKLKSPGRPIINEEKLRSLAEMAKRLSE